MNQSPAGYDRSRARLHLSKAARDVCEFARAMIPTYSDNHAEPGEHLTAARRLRLAAERCIDAAMAVEAAEGATTADLATWLALPADTVQVRLNEVTRAAAAADPGERAAELDRWYAQTGGPDAPADAVSAGLF